MHTAGNLFDVHFYIYVLISMMMDDGSCSKRYYWCCDTTV